MILLSLTGLLVLLFTLPVRLLFCYDGKPCLQVKVLFLSFSIFPKKKKKWKMKEHLPEYQTKRKKRKKPQASPVKYEAKKERPTKKWDRIKDTIEHTYRLLDLVIFPLLERLGKNLTVRISRLEIIIGSSDAAKSALRYAAAVNSAYALLAFLDEHTKLKKKASGTVDIRCDFSAQTSTALCEVELSICLYRALRVVLPALMTYLREFTEDEPPVN
ncbi:MAG: hypothetical protein IJZ37_04255 [Clostridia bacterium]|nr:hypothetical protein [Clostridia bacterium]MBQ8235880.1 hypothetical protein [Clostridia bacterium]